MWYSQFLGLKNQTAIFSSTGRFLKKLAKSFRKNLTSSQTCFFSIQEFLPHQVFKQVDITASQVLKIIFFPSGDVIIERLFGVSNQHMHFELLQTLKHHCFFFCSKIKHLKSCSFPIHWPDEIKNSHELTVGRNVFFSNLFVWKDIQLKDLKR